MKNHLSHLNSEGDASMVDVSGKEMTVRTAAASGEVLFPENVFEVLKSNGFTNKKGGIIQTAVIAGIQAAKKTSELIPLCHQLALSNVKVEIFPVNHSLSVHCTVSCNGRTGVEMEALTAVSVSALTIYDMCKALSHDIVIKNIQLQRKTGGKNDFKR